MQDFRGLKVWEKSHTLALRVYRATQRVRRSEYPGLVPQLRRSAASIPANIAEGCGHSSRREFARFLQMAIASAFELEYHLILAADLAVIQRSTYVALHAEVKEVKRMLVGLIRRVRAGPAPRHVTDALDVSDD